jgi:hypothetical protein
MLTNLLPRVADRPQRGRPHVTTPRQDRAICLAHLRNRHVTATETTLTTVGNYNRHIHPKTEKPIARGMITRDSN